MNDRKIRIDDFSSGLWRLKVELIPFSGDRVEFSIEDAKPFLDATDTDSPLLIRVNRTYLQVWEGQSIPYKSIAVPGNVESKLSFDLPQEKYIMIPKNQNSLKKVLMSEGIVDGFDDDG